MTTLYGQENKSQNFSVDTVRNLLKLDNKGIAKLCAQVSLMPKKDRHGRTYFSKDDMEILKRVRNNSQEAKSIENSFYMESSSPSMLPAKRTSAGVEKIVSSLETLEDNLTSRISNIIDEKLDGLDEVIVELVRCKTENETLRYKLNELNKENYNIKNELTRFNPLGMGFYIKKSKDSIL